MTTPTTAAGRRLLGKNAGSDRDPAWVEWLANDILAIEQEARTTPRAASALDVVRLSQAFLRVNNFMDGVAASEAAERIAAEYAALGILAIEAEADTTPPAGADLRAALARAIEGGYADDSIDADLYQNDAVHHAVVWEVRTHRAAGATPPAGADLRAALERAAEVLDQSGGDRYAIEARGILRAALATQPRGTR